MSLSGDSLVDRHRLKRRLGWWRLVAILALIAVAVVAAARAGLPLGRDHIARLSIEGLILDDQKRTDALTEIADDGRIKALVVRIDSPGGTVVGGEALYRQLRKVAKAKPVVAVMGELATSAAYMLALGSDRIFAREGTITGSIGVILQSADVTDLLAKIGVKAETIKSSPLKAQPNPFEPLTPAARKAISKVVLDIYAMFVGLVEERRQLGRERVEMLTDGRVFTGRQALADGLIDAIGGESEALDWLAETRGIDRSLPVREVDLAGPEETLRELITGLVGKALFSETLRLDGLVSLWHPEL